MWMLQPNSSQICIYWKRGNGAKVKRAKKLSDHDIQIELRLPKVIEKGNIEIIWVFPKIGGKPPKWMVYKGKPY